MQLPLTVLDEHEIITELAKYLGEKWEPYAVETLNVMYANVPFGIFPSHSQEATITAAATQPCRSGIDWVIEHWEYFSGAGNTFWNSGWLVFLKKFFSVLKVMGYEIKEEFWAVAFDFLDRLIEELEGEEDNEFLQEYLGAFSIFFGSKAVYKALEQDHKALEKFEERLGRILPFAIMPHLNNRFSYGDICVFVEMQSGFLRAKSTSGLKHVETLCQSVYQNSASIPDTTSKQQNVFFFCSLCNFLDFVLESEKTIEQSSILNDLWKSRIIPAFLNLFEKKKMKQAQIYGIGVMAIKTPNFLWEAISDGKFLSQLFSLHESLAGITNAKRSVQFLRENVIATIGRFILGLWNNFDETTRNRCLDKYLKFSTEFQIDYKEIFSQLLILRDMTLNADIRPYLIKQAPRMVEIAKWYLTYKADHGKALSTSPVHKEAADSIVRDFEALI
eukprot:TRINITY_DN16897_c0_g1_i1.p1 TRINITY_DN16897_c0_g1~~TRINITY_DN16897_c0_g1_i1.p1  ORF type:complete len:498 (+),score=68.05 TRINITY_DN16897_c0_g1_i1:158-1495(+)